MRLSGRWRKAAIDRWYDSQGHVGQADTDPEPYVVAAADAAAITVLRRLRNTPERHTVGVMTVIERLLDELGADPRDPHA